MRFGNLLDALEGKRVLIVEDCGDLLPEDNVMVFSKKFSLHKRKVLLIQPQEEKLKIKLTFE